MNQTVNKLLLNNVRELRFILCQKSANSLGMRNWLNQNFVNIKQNNPGTLLLIRECENAIPNILARYEYGVERKTICEYASTEEISEIVDNIVKNSSVINSYISKGN